MLAKKTKTTRSTIGWRETASKYYKEISIKWHSFLLLSPHMHKGEKRWLAKKRMVANQVGGVSLSVKKHWFFFKSDRHLGRIGLYTYTRNETNIYFTLSFLYFIFCTPLFHGCHHFLASQQLQRSSYKGTRQNI